MTKKDRKTGRIRDKSLHTYNEKSPEDPMERPHNEKKKKKAVTDHIYLSIYLYLYLYKYIKPVCLSQSESGGDTC